MSGNNEKLSVTKIGKSVSVDPIAWAMEKNTRRKVPILPLRFAYRDNDQDVEIAIGLSFDQVQKLHTDIGQLLHQHKHLLH